MEGEYTIRAASRVLGIDRRTLARLIDRGRVTARWTITGRCYIARRELVRLLGERHPSLRVPIPPNPPSAWRRAFRRIFGAPK